MKMVKFLVILAAVVATCAWSYDYTEGHQSTLRKQKNKECMEELDRISGEKHKLANECNDLRSQLRWKIKQLCELLEVSKIESDICKEPVEEEVEEEVEEGENSDE